jgi:hypothetical protein
VRNFNSLMVETSSTAITINDDNVPLTAPIVYNASGVITINTVLATIDCSQIRTVFVSGQAGTTGVITPEWFNATTNTWHGAMLIPPTGATSATITTTANRWAIHVTGQTLRFRLSTATTAGNTQLEIRGSREPIAMNPNTIAATQSGTWNIGTVTPGGGATNLGKAEDAVHASGDTGVAVWGVRVDDMSAASPSASGDYTYQHVNRKGARSIVPFEHHVRGYRSVVVFTPAATSTDILDIYGNASTTVEVRRITIHGIATATSEDLMYIVKRSTANTGGTRVAMTAVPMDAVWAGASSVPGSYSANPTTGTLIGNIGVAYVPLVTASGGSESGHEWCFGINGTPPLRLIGTSQGIAINRNSVVVPAGMTIAVEIEWVEYIA